MKKYVIFCLCYIKYIYICTNLLRTRKKFVFFHRKETLRYNHIPVYNFGIYYLLK